MNEPRNPSDKSSRRSHTTWVWAIAIASLLAAATGLYLAAWQRDSSWQWAFAAALAYLVPVTLAALSLGWRDSMVTAGIGALTIIPHVWQSWRLGRPSGMIAGLVIVALLLPAWAHLMGTRAASQRRAGTRVLRLGLRPRPVEQLAHLVDIGNAFRAGESLPEIMALTAQAISKGVGVGRTVISLTEREPPVLHNVAAVGVAPSAWEQIQSVQCPLSAVLDVIQDRYRISQSYFVPSYDLPTWMDALRTGLFVPAADSGQGEGLLIVPMYGSTQRITGFIAVDQPPSGRVSDRSLVEVLQVFAHQAAISMENYRLRNDLQRGRDDLELYTSVGQVITSDLDLERSLEQIVAASVRLLNSDYGALFTWDEESEGWVPTIAHGFSVGDTRLFSESQLKELIALVVIGGRPLVLSDTSADPRFSNLLAGKLPIRSLLLVPVVERQKGIGMLLAATSQASVFDQTDQAWLSALANQASAAIQNNRLHKQAATRTKQLATLTVLGEMILSGPDIDTALARIVDEVQAISNAESGVLLLMEEGKLAPRLSFGLARDRETSLSQELGQGTADWAALTGSSVLIPDVKKDRRYSLAVGPATRSLLCVPLKNPDDNVIGVIEVANPTDKRAFTDQDRELLESIAPFAVIALQNAQLHQQTVDHIADLSSLYEVGQAITSRLDIEDTLQIAVDETARLTSAARSQILLVDEESRQVTHLVQRGYSARFPAAIAYEQATRGLHSWVLREKIPTLSAHVYEDERMRGAPVEHLTGPDARSLIIAPLLIKGYPVGTLSAVRTAAADPFTERELELLNTLAGQASIAIENARFFEERKRQITELSILNQMGQSLSSSLELADLLDLIYRQVARVMDAQNFYIALWDPEQEVISFPLAYEHGVQQAGPNHESLSEEWLPRQGRMGLTERIIQTKKHLWLPSQVQEWLEKEGVEEIGEPALSWLGVPILADDRVLGVIAVQSLEQENDYDQGDLDLLMTIASQASAHIRNAQLFAQVTRMSETLEQVVAERTEALARANQELRVERDRLDHLYQITRQLSSSLQLERVLSQTLVLISQALDIQQGYILVQDVGTTNWTYRASVGTTAPSPDGSAFPSPRVGDKVGCERDRGMIGWLASQQDSVRIGNLRNRARWQIVQNQHRWHSSVLAAPLLLGEEATGAILLYHALPDHFTADHQRMIGAIASQIAITVSNADMFRLLRESADRLGNMLRTQQLEASKSHAILEGVADGVMVTDAVGEITLFNVAAEHILQRPRTEVIGRSVQEMSGILNLAGTSWPELAERWGGGRIQPGQEDLYDDRLELEDRVISMRVAPLIREGEFGGTASVFRDITKDVEVDRVKSEFVSSVSHELRTPMTSIKGYIDLLYGGMVGPVSAEQRRFLQIVKNNADRLTTLVNELLDLSSIDSGRLNLMLEPVDPVYIVDSVLTDRAPRAAEQGLDVRSLIEEPLPSVRADPTRLTQILTNLVENAVKYTPTGGQVRISAQVVKQDLHFHITDSGIGISRVDQEKLFGRFFRADNTTVQTHSGSGLGLSIVKAMVELHGGEVWLKSRLGEGSTFSFSIPLAEQGLRAKPRPEFRTVSYRVQDKHILVVEDQNDEANWIAHQLRSQGGYRVHVVRSGRDALDYLTNSGHPTDLITLDLRLPDMDGLQVLQQIRKTQSLSAIPVVIISVRRRDKDGQRLDAEAYLTKPIEAGRLLATIEEILSEKAKVLIVEDDQSLAHLFREALERHGFEVVLRYDGRQAVSAARVERPGLILLDIKLPGMDGFEVLSRLKNTPETRNTPVIVVTGSVTDAEGKRRRVLDMGAMQFLTKPLDVGALIAEIQEVLVGESQEGVVSSN